MAERGRWRNTVSVLTSAAIRDRIFSENNSQKRLTVTPLLEPEEQIQGGSLDIRLGNHFLLFERGNQGLIDPIYQTGINEVRATERKQYIPLTQYLVIHPNQFVLGCSLEYFGLPNDLLGNVVGRSSWGRLGLVIATASAIHAGYRGIITLELTNLGEVPIAVYPSWPIAQIFFSEVLQTQDEEGESDITPYSLSVRPEASKLSPPSRLLKLIEAAKDQSEA